MVAAKILAPVPAPVVWPEVEDGVVDARHRVDQPEILVGVEAAHVALAPRRDKMARIERVDVRRGASDPRQKSRKHGIIVTLALARARLVGKFHARIAGSSRYFRPVTLFVRSRSIAT